MKILVCVSKTPDTTAKISFSSDGKEFNGSGVQYILNPYDEWYALVKGIELVESNGGAVTVLNVGPADNETIIRKALAIGANDAVRIDITPKSPWEVAHQIANYAKQNSFDLVLLGKETIDYNDSEVGALLAELLDLPFISYGNAMTIEGKIATISRDIEGGVEVIEVELPAVVSCAKGMAEQRIPNMKGIMTAKSKPLVVIPGIAVEDTVELVEHTLPPAKQAVKLIDPENMDELVRLLHEEAKVI